MLRSKYMVGDHYQYKLNFGTDVQIGQDKADDLYEQWTDGYLFTFWAFDHNYPGTTQFFVYYTMTNPYSGSNNSTRFTMSRYNRKPDGWNSSFSFWAFEDDSVKNYLGNVTN